MYQRIDSRNMIKQQAIFVISITPWGSCWVSWIFTLQEGQQQSLPSFCYPQFSIIQNSSAAGYGIRHSDPLILAHHISHAINRQWTIRWKEEDDQQLLYCRGYIVVYWLLYYQASEMQHGACCASARQYTSYIAVRNSCICSRTDVTWVLGRNLWQQQRWSRNLPGSQIQSVQPSCRFEIMQVLRMSIKGLVRLRLPALITTLNYLLINELIY